MSKDVNLPLPSFRIIKIIDDETIVINAGSNNNISRGDEFEIYEIGENIKDPVSGENLGSLDTIKDTVEAVTVFPKMCICKHLDSYANSVGSIATLITRNTPKTLNVDVSQISGGLSSDKTIRIGDKARKIQK